MIKYDIEKRGDRKVMIKWWVAMIEMPIFNKP